MNLCMFVLMTKGGGGNVQDLGRMILKKDKYFKLKEGKMYEDF